MDDLSKRFSLYPAGDAALVIEFGRRIDLSINRQVHHLAALLSQDRPAGAGEAVPAYASLMVHYDPARLDYAAAAAWVEERAAHLDSTPEIEPRRVEIPVVYGGNYGPDLAFLADYHHIPVETAIRLHSSAVYTVYMLGFTPGFAYLGGLPEELATPRLESPRTRVPAGSVGIAGSQTAVYPIESPGGWRIIGYTPFHLFDPQREPPTLLAAGDLVCFIPTDPAELHV